MLMKPSGSTRDAVLAKALYFELIGEVVYAERNIIKPN